MHQSPLPPFRKRGCECFNPPPLPFEREGGCKCTLRLFLSELMPEKVIDITVARM